MSQEHGHGESYSFKHDTSNLAIFSILILSLALVMATMAATYVVFHHLRDEEKTVKSVIPAELSTLRSEEDAVLAGLDAAVQAVIARYSR